MHALDCISHFSILSLAIFHGLMKNIVIRILEQMNDSVGFSWHLFSILFPSSLFNPFSSPSVWQLFSILRWLGWNMYLLWLFYLSSYCSSFFSLPGEISVMESEVWIKGTFIMVTTLKVKFRPLEHLKQRNDWNPHHLHLIL